MKPIHDLLDAVNVPHTVLSTGELFFRRPTGRGVMYVRRYDDGAFDWARNDHSDENLMELRSPKKERAGKAIAAVREFLSA
jgi:hypothetical protein